MIAFHTIQYNTIQTTQIQKETMAKMGDHMKNVALPPMANR